MRQLIIWLSCFLCANSIFAQTHHYYVSTHYGLKEGLNSKNIFKSLNLPNGQLLLATNRGLSLFDGHRFLSNKHINLTTTTIYTTNNLTFFSNINGLFELKNVLSTPQKRISSIQTDSNPNNDHFENILIDSQNLIWTTDFENVKYFDPQNQKIKEFSHPPRQQGNISPYFHY